MKGLCCMSLMKVMDLLARMKYEDVYLLGFDGTIQQYHYFWQDPTFYPGHADAWNQAVEAGVKVKRKSPTGWSMDTGGHVFEVQSTGRTKHGNNGYEQVLTAFAMYNGIRLINLSSQSTLTEFIYTRSVDEALSDLGARSQAESSAEPVGPVLQLTAMPATQPVDGNRKSRSDFMR